MKNFYTRNSSYLLTKTNASTFKSGMNLSTELKLLINIMNITFYVNKF